MPSDRHSSTVPFTIRLLLALAGWMLPARARVDWKREWYAEFWHSRQLPSRRRPMRAFGVFPDAWFLARHEHGIGCRLGELARSRSFAVAALIFLIAALGVATNGFRRSRDLLGQHDSDRLFLLAQPVPFMGRVARIPEAQAKAWIEHGGTVETLGRWSVRQGAVCAADRVAATLFSEVHMMPQCAAIKPASVELAGFSGVIGRLKPGASRAEAERELEETAVLHRGWLRPAIVPIEGLRRAPLAPVGAALFVLALFSLVSVRAASAPAWTWAVSRVALFFGLIAGGWLELVARAPFTEAAGVPGIWTALLYVFPIATATLAAHWLRSDGRGRCRICCRPLGMPVFVGFSGRCLMESGGVEYLCTAGHGALVAGSVPGQVETEEWSKWPNTLA
jgi:hypothetical protein